MQNLIQTPNLGPVALSSHVIRFFMNNLADGDIAKATKKIIVILQSQEIERLETPTSLSGLEFWVHQSSSLVFTTLPKDGFKLLSLVLKSDMSNFVF